VSRRQSIDVAGLQHENPIPCASRIGSLLMSSGIFPIDPATGRAPEGAGAQCATLFANIRRIVEGAGATTEDIVKVTVWVKDASSKEYLNREWLKMFPHPQSRPARHTFSYPDVPKGMLVQCEIVAVLRPEKYVTDQGEKQ
jgi:enamine deaminase RidA (YjgF/YER057c/UK114 family)